MPSVWPEQRVEAKRGEQWGQRGGQQADRAGAQVTREGLNFTLRAIGGH